MCRKHNEDTWSSVMDSLGTQNIEPQTPAKCTLLVQDGRLTPASNEDGLQWGYEWKRRITATERLALAERYPQMRVAGFTTIYSTFT